MQASRQWDLLSWPLLHVCTHTHTLAELHCEADHSQNLMAVEVGSGLGAWQPRPGCQQGSLCVAWLASWTWVPSTRLVRSHCLLSVSTHVLACGIFPRSHVMTVLSEGVFPRSRVITVICEGIFWDLFVSANDVSISRPLRGLRPCTGWGLGIPLPKDGCQGWVLRRVLSSEVRFLLEATDF